MTSIKTTGALGLVLGITLLTGCGMLKKKQAEPAPSATAAAQAAAPVATPAPTPLAPPPVAEPTVADESVAAPEDFEDEAFEKVSDKTYKSELAGLKKDIEAK
jgi:hypothetical protein